MIDYAVISGLTAFLVTLVLALIRGDRFAANDPGVIGGKRDILPGTLGILSALCISLTFEYPVKPSAVFSAAFGMIAASFCFLIFKKFKS